MRSTNAYSINAPPARVHRSRHIPKIAQLGPPSCQVHALQQGVFNRHKATPIAPKSLLLVLLSQLSACTASRQEVGSKSRPRLRGISCLGKIDPPAARLLCETAIFFGKFLDVYSGRNSVKFLRKNTYVLPNTKLRRAPLAEAGLSRNEPFFGLF